MFAVTIKLDTETGDLCIESANKECAKELIKLLTPEDWNSELDKTPPSIYKKENDLNIYVKTTINIYSELQSSEVITFNLSQATKSQKEVLAKFRNVINQTLFSFFSIKDSNWYSTPYLRGIIDDETSFTLYSSKDVAQQQATPLPPYNSNNSHYGRGSSAQYTSPPLKPSAPINNFSLNKRPSLP